MGLVKELLAYRLDIDVEYQQWLLGFATLTAVFLFFLPCYCSGLSCQWARQFSNRMHRHLPKFVVLMAMFNAGWMFLLITWLPDYDIPGFIKAAVKAAGFTVSNVLLFAGNFVHIAAFVFVIVFRDRIALVLGVEHLQLFKFKAKDVCQCFSGGSYRAIEVSIWKAEELIAGDIFNANNVFVEVHYGMNEVMRTRVHNNAGSECIIKERIQVNFDEGDDDEIMYIFLKNQKVMGASDLGRIDLNGTEVRRIEQLSRQTQMNWNVNNFIKKSLHPTGSIYLRIDPVDEEQGSGLLRDLTTC